jgi:flagellar hook assembly protein FlgD
VVNATTGATQNSNAVRTCTWNGTDVSGAVVLDGTYKVCMNIADGKTAFASFPFVKGPTAVTLTPANVSGFSSISIGWVH